MLTVPFPPLSRFPLIYPEGDLRTAHFNLDNTSEYWASFTIFAVLPRKANNICQFQLGLYGQNRWMPFSIFRRFPMPDNQNFHNSHVQRGHLSHWSNNRPIGYACPFYSYTYERIFQNYRFKSQMLTNSECPSHELYTFRMSPPLI